MKKTIPVLAILGGITALATYKLKKNKQKKFVYSGKAELYDDAIVLNDDELMEEGPICEHSSQFVENTKAAFHEIEDNARDLMEGVEGKSEEIINNTKQSVKKNITEVMEGFPDLEVDESNSTKEKEVFRCLPSKFF